MTACPTPMLNVYSSLGVIESCTDEEESFKITVHFNYLPHKDVTFVSANTRLDLLSNIIIIISLIVGVSSFQLSDWLSKFAKWIKSNIGHPNYQETNKNERVDQLWIEIEKITILSLLHIVQMKRPDNLNTFYQYVFYVSVVFYQRK